ncbi:hypothetical protein KC354_g6645 [Hortaea werneckii]|nr:hypothetical protein KC354_g6645 [Hortaea werneckii]
MKGKTPKPDTAHSRTPSREEKYAWTTGSAVLPGKILSREERQKRRDSGILVDGTTEAIQNAPDDASFKALWRKLLEALHRRLDCLSAYEHHRIHDLEEGDYRHPMDIRSLVLLLIAFLIVFGSAYTLIDHILIRTRASAASCTPSTVFVPVTTTVTYIPPTAAGFTSTIYSTSTLTKTVSIFPAITSATIVSSSDGPSYFYSVVSGTTDWLNGLSPPPGVSLTTGTTSFYLSPVATVATSTLDSTITVHTTATVTQTLTPPPYTSTIFDLSALSNSPTTITSTSTRTRTIEVSLAGVSSHASYSGMGSAGWNSTSRAQGAAAPTDAAVTSMETPYTYTEIHYWGTGNQTTLTSTRLLTTTLHLTAPSTITFTDTVPSVPDSTLSTTSLLVGAETADSTSSASMPATEGSGLLSSTSIYDSVPSTGFPSLNSVTPGVYGNSTSLAAAASPTSTIVSSMPSVAASSSLSANTSFPSVSASNSVETALPATGSSSFATSTAPGNSSIGGLESTTATLVVPVTSSLPFGSGLTVISETTSTTLGLSSSNPATVSGYFVYNGTTTVPIWPGPGTGNPAPYSATLSEVTSSSAELLRPIITVTHFGQCNPGYSCACHSIEPGSVSQLKCTTGDLVEFDGDKHFLDISITCSLVNERDIIEQRLWPDTGPTSSSSVRSSSQETSLSAYGGLPSASSTTTPASSAGPGSAPSGTPSTCGEHGNFTLDFDTLPNFVPNNQNSTDITQAPPVPNPYHHLIFSDGYVYGPSPKVPYVPSSQPKLAVFLANASGVTARPRSSTMESGEVGDGPYESASAFWFDAYSAFFGCDSPDGCTMVFTGYTYSADAKDEVPSYSQNATIPACPTLTSGNASCQLQRVDFPRAFRGLSGLRMQAFSGNEERMFFLDDLALGWTNNDCEADTKLLKSSFAERAALMDSKSMPAPLQITKDRSRSDLKYCPQDGERPDGQRIVNECVAEIDTQLESMNAQRMVRGLTQEQAAEYASAIRFCMNRATPELSRAHWSLELGYGVDTNLPHEETQSPSAAYYPVDQPDSYSELDEKDSRTSSESVRTVRYAPQEVESDRAPPSRHEPRRGFSRKQSLASLTRKLSGLLGHGGSVKQEVNEEFGKDEPSRRKLNRKFSLPHFRGVGSLRKSSKTLEPDELCSKVSYLAPSLDRPDKRDRAEIWSRSLSQDLLDFKGLDADKEVSSAPCSGFGEYEQLSHHQRHRQRALKLPQRSELSEKRHAQPPRLGPTIDARPGGPYGNHLSSAAGASSLTGRTNAPVSTPPQVYELEDKTVSAGFAQKRVCSIDTAHGWTEARDSGVAKPGREST